MHNKKPTPLLMQASKPQRLCSVCGLVSYSLSEIHPQCAQEQADAPRVERLKSAKKAETKERVAKSDAISHWHKVCPKCHTQLHVRKLICDCGHRFSQAAGG